MTKKLFDQYVYPIVTLMGSVIGVGFLSLPYITLKVGLWPMLFYFVVLSLIVLYINLIFVHICLCTPDHKRFPGFVEYYLGKNAKTFTLVSVICGSMGVLLAYLFVGSSFLSGIGQPLVGGSAIWYAAGYFAVASLVVFFGPGANTKLDFWGLALLLAILILVVAVGWPNMHLGNVLGIAIPASLDWKTFLLPYGAILFSMWGTGLIPQVEESLHNSKKLLRRVVIISTVAVALVYLVFIFIVLSLSGSGTTDSALVGISQFLPPGISGLVLFVGVIATFIAFISQGIYLKEVFMYDMGLSSFKAWALTCFVPMGLFLAGVNSFIGIISLVGGVLLGINGIFTLKIYEKVGGSKYAIYPLIVFFISGVCYELLFFIR